ncbi:ATPase [Leptospira levettii]|uniref:SRPBCC family protein n=1 Tax=Leptospira levettii TaxID=2023178 RepID=UPI000C297CA5|nr:SRPBCC domain-containing protein [Leptospira levettii]MCW7475444.1 SRPBCC domain-containing protein [Leptospira levettii]PJZ88727.1 ATPase [Leptospira levettii]PJZ99672.1 ATPase [Leptospira levettii]
MNAQVVKVEKEINADPKRIFQAWLNADYFSRWFLSGENIGIESVFIDPRPGGKFTINMSLDGKILPHTGEYIIIEEPNKLVFTWCSHATNNRDTLVTVTLKDISKKTNDSSVSANSPRTLVTLVHEKLISDIEIKNHYHGWTNVLEGLDCWFHD